MSVLAVAAVSPGRYAGAGASAAVSCAAGSEGRGCSSRPRGRLLPITRGTFWSLADNLLPPGSAIPGTEDLNRYSNILPAAATRVVLREPVQVGPQAPGRGHSTATSPESSRLTERSRYINANYVRSFPGNPRAYIATQGPLEETTVAFWQMIWEHKSPVVVMLTGLVEGGRTKCDRYWPTQEGTVATYGKLQVRLVGRQSENGSTISHLVVRTLGSDGNNEHRVSHIAFEDWPDHGVPAEPEALLRLQLLVDRHALHLRVDAASEAPADRVIPPVTVHCSAGIGRTGAFIAVDTGIRMLSAGQTVDLAEITRRMREDRGGLIQTDEQFAFVHRALTLFERKS